MFFEQKCIEIFVLSNAVEYSFSKRMVCLTLKYSGKLHWPFQYHCMVTCKWQIKEGFSRKRFFNDVTLRRFSKIFLSKVRDVKNMLHPGGLTPGVLSNPPGVLSYPPGVLSYAPGVEDKDDFY